MSKSRDSKQEMIQLYAMAAEAGGIGILDYDAEGGVLVADRQCKLLLGFPRSTPTVMYLQRFMGQVYKEDREATSHFMAGFQSNPGMDEGDTEFRVLHPDGSLHWLHLRLMALNGSASKGNRKVGILQDISSRKNYEAALIDAKERSEKANNAKSEFLAMVSHEIRTPLNAICGFSELLHLGELDSDARAFVTNILESGRQLEATISNILDYTRLDAGKGIDLKVKAFDVGEEVEHVFRLMRPKAEEKNLDLEVVRKGSAPEEITCDPQRFRQIVFNILDNAIKFTEKGKVTVVLSGESAREDGKVSHLVFMVKDTGIGIAGEWIESMFDPFTQADTSSTRTKGGIGMGLAIVKRLVELFGGVIECESGQGKGACFTVRLPKHYLKEEFFVEPGGSIAPVRPLKILCAEDNIPNQLLMEGLLKNMGHSPDFASDGLETIEILRFQTYDAILMDVHMPHLDGLKATERIRMGACGEANRHIPIIGVTAFAMQGDRERCFEAGMDDYLSKPLRNRELAEKLRVLENLRFEKNLLKRQRAMARQTS